LFSIALAVLLGLLFGVGLFTFGYGKGASYLSSNPKNCANCHVMQAHYDSWQNSTHRHVAACNDCHLPHDMLGHWLTEADNGFNHSLALTLENFHEPIQIKDRSRRVTEAACRKCHQDIVHDIDTTTTSDASMSCIRCHGGVGHME